MNIRRLFPWALFLALAALFAMGACSIAYAGGDVKFCATVREYLQSHTVEEARAAARAKRIPEWIIRKAERCLR